MLAKARTPPPVFISERDKRTAACAARLLETRDSALRKPYMALRSHAPLPIPSWMPDWPDPSYVRKTAAEYLAHFAAPGQARFVPPLLKVARDDPDSQTRDLAIAALSNIGVYSEDILAVMLATLTNPTNIYTARNAVHWFRQTTPDPEKVVPILVKGLEHPAKKSDYAAALRCYGTKARFAVEPLLILSRTNDPAVASVALWALQAIDPRAAKTAGLSTGREQPPSDPPEQFP